MKVQMHPHTHRDGHKGVTSDTHTAITVRTQPPAPFDNFHFPECPALICNADHVGHSALSVPD